ncbi:MAG: hypothetical protein PHT98_08935, partial [Kiritimatiellae bacterium]|nr:hypothetical protein [Kiritimatiellia bacterium]
MEQEIEIDRTLPRQFPLDILVRRPEEVSRRLASHDMALVTIFKTGVALYACPRNYAAAHVGQVAAVGIVLTHKGHAAVVNHVARAEHAVVLVLEPLDEVRELGVAELDLLDSGPAWLSHPGRCWRAGFQAP